MRLNIKRVVVLILAFVLGTASICLAGTVIPMKSQVIYYDVYHDVYDFGASVGNLHYFTLAGEPAFCIQPGRAVRGTNGEKFLIKYENAFNIDFAVSQVTGDQSVQSKIAYLGYLTLPSPTIRDYAFTQMMIWQTLPESYKTANGKDSSGNFRSYFTDASLASQYNQWKSNIEEKIRLWNIGPSFASSDIAVTAGLSTKVSDNNGVLKDYESFSCQKDGISITHTKGQNYMTVTAGQTCKKNRVSFSAAELEKAGAVKYPAKAKVNYVYSAESSQDMVTYGNVLPAGLALTFNVALLGDLEITKTCEDGFVEGIELVLKSQDGSYEKTLFTDEDGKIQVKDLAIGKYILTEKTPIGYITKESVEIEIKTCQKTEIEIENKLQRGKITLTKTGDRVMSYGQGEAGSYDITTKKVPLEGGVYEIVACEDRLSYNGDYLQRAGQVVDTLTTGQDGSAISKSLFLGKYIVREIEAPYGYEMDLEEHEVQLAYDESQELVTASLEVTDQIRTGRMRAVFAFRAVPPEESVEAVTLSMPEPLPQEPELDPVIRAINTQVPKTGLEDGLWRWSLTVACYGAVAIAFWYSRSELLKKRSL